MSTEAGKRLLWEIVNGHPTPVDRAAIEDEARRTALISLREKVTGLEKDWQEDSEEAAARLDFNRAVVGVHMGQAFAHVLAEIDRALQ